MLIDTLIAGDSLSFLTSTPGYSASDGWQLHYRLIPTTAGSALLLDGSAEGDEHRVQVAASVTASWGAGDYSWVSWVSRASEVYTVASGQLVVRPDPRTATAGWDGRSQARKALDDARAALAAWTPTRKRYKIGEREMEFNTAGEIIKLITYWEQQVRSEDILAGRAEKPARRIYSRI